MSEPFLGEIKIVSFNFPPKGWAFCDGQLLPINQNQALFSILGTTYGGDGRVNFGLPNFQGRVPLHVGNGFNLGQSGGEQTHTLQTSELPTHAHGVAASSSAGLLAPTNAFFGESNQAAYSPPGSNGVAMNPAAVSVVGGSQPHQNMSPYLTLNFVIALQGIFPSRS